ncbi:MAG: sporulation protein YqfD [Clostridia bacterium]|nr:sporulation protein YqfD [Clostridia bacterium]
MLFLYRFFCGVLSVEFSGIYPEKVLNLCTKNKISIWSAKFKNGKINCKITVKDFLKLPKILRKSGIRVHILRKSGFPFFIKRYSKRFGIFTGFILFFAVLYMMSGYIWIIDVVGNTKTATSDILNVCEQIGIKTGVKASGISAKNVAQQLLLKTDTLAWSSFNIEGCRLTVNVTEIKEKPEDNSKATNLKASADGIITHIDVKSGNCLVKVGDVVKTGDILVSGIIESESNIKFVHSIGEITAETETEFALQEPLKKRVSYPTGKVKEKSVLEFFTLKIPLYLGGETGEYDCQTSEKTLRLFEQNLPLKIYTKKFVFKKYATVTQSLDDAKNLLLKKLQKECTGEVKRKNFIERDGTLFLTAVVTDKKNIAISENLIFSIGK